MLLKVDSQFGHVIEETDRGVVYQVDGVLVDGDNPRPCVGCQAKCAHGTHDPCIANLPNTRNACCGHGLDVTPMYKRPNGYVALEDGRTFRFSGLVGGERIRQAVDAALKGEDLPEGFAFDDEKAWWAGLSEAQRQYVQDNTHNGLVELVTEVRNGQPVSPAFLNGEAFWFDGLNDEEKEHVRARLGGMIEGLVQKALANSQ